MMKKYKFLFIRYIFVTVFIVHAVKSERNIAMESELPYEYDVNRYGNVITTLNDGLSLMCTKELDLNFGKFNQTRSLKSVSIIWCLPPNNSYAQFFQSININVTALKMLHLNFKNAVNVELSKLQFSNLGIEKLHIENDGFPLNIQITKDFLEPLNTLRSLIVEKIAFPPIPDNVKLSKLILKNGISIAEFGGCQNLEELQLIYWEVPRGSRNWLGNCSHLHVLKLERISPVALAVALEGVHSNIQNLTLTRCDLTEIPLRLLTKATALKHFDMSYNYLQFISYAGFVWLQSLENLESLDLSHNELTTDGFNVVWVAEVGSSTHKIRDISIANNPLPSECEENATNYYENTRVSTTRLSYAFTSLSKICFNSLIIENLEYLDLTNNNISVLKFDQLPASDSHYIADLRKNPLHIISFEEQDYKNYKIQNSSMKTNATIHMDSTLDCDCKHAWYARALREGILSANGAICEDQIEVTLKPHDSLECVKTEEKSCIFRESWNDGTVVATCNNTDIDVLPAGKMFKEIHAADNEIDIIRLEDLPPTLQFLDLQRNSIARIDEEVTRALFNHSRHLLLKGNPILCNCNNKHFVEQLQKHHLQVDDYDNLTCAGEVLTIREVNTDDLCSILPLIPTVTGGIFFSLVLLAYIIYRMYGQDIKMFLFTHGWCLLCVREEDLDADRTYDAFISFSHQDFQVVNEKIIPGLEPGYHICVHYRDWLVGEWIPAQIQTSIQSSKRTIIVLSRNYLESVWGMFEFRMAFALALKEGRTRIIIIMLDDVTSAEMAPDLHHFVSNNTYLKWEDPWFWQKLRYALPHKINGINNTQSSEDTNRNEVRNLKADDSCHDIVLRVSINNVSEHVIISEAEHTL